MAKWAHCERKKEVWGCFGQESRKKNWQYRGSSKAITVGKANYRCPIWKSSNRTPVIGHPRNRAPITWQIGARKTNHDREFCYRYDYLVYSIPLAYTLQSLIVLRKISTTMVERAIPRLTIQKRFSLVLCPVTKSQFIHLCFALPISSRKISLVTCSGSHVSWALSKNIKKSRKTWKVAEGFAKELIRRSFSTLAVWS